jgi:hypothetical protein
MTDVPELKKEYNFKDKLSIWFDQKSFIVLTMGKVGTMTILNSLKRLGLRQVHVHSLRYTRPGVHFLKNVKLSFAQELFFYYKTITKRLKVRIWLLFIKEVTIISGVRDPFSRTISAFFEQCHHIGIDTEQAGCNVVYDSFEHYYDLEASLNWFDKEIKNVFSIDIFSTPFDKEKGYQVIQKGKYKLFIYRLDHLNNLEEELRMFIGNEDFKIETTGETLVNESYSQLKKEKRFTLNEFDKVMSSRYLNHFYTEEEIQLLKEKWVQ